MKQGVLGQAPAQPEDVVGGAGVLQVAVVRVLNQQRGRQVLAVEPPGCAQRGERTELPAQGQPRRKAAFSGVVEVGPAHSRFRGYALRDGALVPEVGPQLVRAHLLADAQLPGHLADAVGPRRRKEGEIAELAAAGDPAAQLSPRMRRPGDVAAQRDPALLRGVGEQQVARLSVEDVGAEVGVGEGEGSAGKAAAAPQPAPAGPGDVLVGLVDDEILVGIGIPGSEVDGVEAGDAEQGDPVPGRQVPAQLALQVAVARHGSGADGVDDEIEIAAPTRGDPGAAPSRQGAFEKQAGSRHAELQLPLELLAAALAQVDDRHRRHAFPVSRGEPPGVEGDVLDEIGVQQADRAARSPLGREVVDVGDLDVVDEDEVLRGAAAAHDEIVALVGIHVDRGHGLQQAAYVAGRSRRAPHLLVAEAHPADRLPGRVGEVVGDHHGLLPQVDHLGVELDLDIGDPARAHDHVGPHHGGVADHRYAQAMHPRGHARQGEAALGVGHRSPL